MKALGLLLLLGLTLTVAPAWPQDTPKSGEVKLDESRDYVVGASLQSSAAHLGSSTGQELKLDPLWAFQWGRFRFATGGASALLSLGREPVDAGVSTVLLSRSRWSLNASLRHDGGRDSSSDQVYAGLPDVRATLRGKASASYALSRRWSWGVSASQDLLNRGGGLQLSTSLGYHHPMTDSTYWDASVGAQWGSRTFLQTHYGISEAAALSSGRAAYLLGSGWSNVGLNWGMASALSSRWVMFGGVGVSRLTGEAADSPFVTRRTVYSARLGLAYRCCR